MARTVRPSTSSPRERRNVRRPPAIAASMTSLTVPPRAFFTVLIAARSVRDQPQRRRGPIAPSRTDSGRITLSPAWARPYRSTTLWRVKPSGDLIARVSPRLTSSNGTRSMSSSAEAASLAGEGSGAGVQASTARALTWGSRSSRTDRMSAPAIPSIMAWWVLLTMAQRPPCKPSTSHVCHSGRDRSRGSDMIAAVRS